MDNILNVPNNLYLAIAVTDPPQLELISLALVSTRGAEHYVELDTTDLANRSTARRDSNLAQDNGVLAQWGKVPGSATSLEEMGIRTARYVVDQVTQVGQPAQIAFTQARDYDLFKMLLRDAGQWQSVRELVRPLDVSELSRTFDALLGAEAAYEWTHRRGLDRHHALADAHALRAACYAVNTGRRIKL